MLYKIEGFNQKKAIAFKDKMDGKEVKLDCTDLVLLRWFALRYENVDKKEIDGKEYVWVNYSSVLEDLPILNMKKVQLSRRFNKFVYFKILDFKLYKVGGTFTYYTYGINYKSLVETVENSEDSCTFNDNGSTKKYNSINKNVETVYAKKYKPVIQKCLNKTYNTNTYNTITYNTSPSKANEVDVEKLKSQIQFDRLRAEAHGNTQVNKIIELIIVLSNRPPMKNPDDEIINKINALDYETCNAIIDRILNTNEIKSLSGFTFWCITHLTSADCNEEVKDKRIKALTIAEDMKDYAELLNVPGGING